jgi:single-stranded-DNA-specific exonuclease
MLPALVDSFPAFSSRATAPLAGIESLTSRCGLSRTVATWLTSRGYSDPNRVERFLSPKLADLTSPETMADRAQVAGRLSAAIRRRERVAVFGDYDCDGITATAILTEAMRALGADVVPLIASRFDGGYGVSAHAAARILSTGARVLVTCDCGSSDHASLRTLAAQGLDVVVIDHHLVPEEPLPALGFLNPHRPECGFPYKGLASCGLALSVVAALRKELGAQLDVRYWLDLVAIGTVADVAPLDGDNRALVRAGLQAIRRAERPGMAALLRMAKVSSDAPVSARDIAFRLAPHLNAPGRLGAADRALELLLAPNAAEAERIAAELDQLSTQRRALSEEMVLQAAEEIVGGGFERDAAIVVGRQGWNHGIVGIVAARLVERFERPVIVIGFDGDAGRGSVRGPAGSRLYDALKAASGVLVRFGGHQQAAGVELQAARLPELRARFAAAVAAQGALPPALRPEALPLDPEDEPARVLADLDRLEPCGGDNPRPKLRVSALTDAAREVKNGHLKLHVSLPKGRVLECFGPNLGHLAQSLQGPITLEGDLRHNTFPGSTPVEFLVDKVTCGIA